MVGKIFAKTIALGLLAFICGCATLYNPATGKKEFIVINSATEQAIGKNTAAEIAKKYPLASDPALQSRISAIGRRVVAASDRQDIEYKFYVVEDKELNAFTLPGGLIYVNRGLAEAFNDDELAYVIAHETGHIAARHIAKKLQANMTYQLLLGMAFATAGKNAGQSAQTLAQGADVVFNLVELKYSRNDEYEADRLGVKYAHNAGFDPYASLSALEKLKKNQGSASKVLQYFRTHPYVEDRIKALKEIILQLLKKK
jgi:predicted Zn-dependent protease